MTTVDRRAYEAAKVRNQRPDFTSSRLHARSDHTDDDVRLAFHTAAGANNKNSFMASLTPLFCRAFDTVIRAGATVAAVLQLPVCARAASIALGYSACAPALRRRAASVRPVRHV